MTSLFSLEKCAVLVAGLLLATPVFAADPPGIVLQGVTGSARTLSPEELAQLPAIQMSVSFGTEHGPRQATFEGPLLWTVLDHAAAIDTAKPREQVRLAVLVEGQDGYAASLALGEISPAFEGKQVILADQQDGKPLESGHFRLVVPGDRMGGRSVQNVARVTVTPLPAPAASR